MSLDRSISNVKTDSKADLEKEKLKYKEYEGLWYNAKVVNIVSPATESFRQKVVMFRNFMPYANDVA